MGSPTLTDVARQCGFSPMTVSRVINGDARVRDSTKKAVHDAISLLNYTPNTAARTLAAANSVRIGLLYSNPSSAYLSRFLVGSLEQAGRDNAELIIRHCISIEQASCAVRDLISVARVDGIILSPPLCDSLEIRSLIEKSCVTAAAVSNWKLSGTVSSIWIDDYAASVAMTDYLISLGHQQIGFIKGSSEQQASIQRLAGFKSALKKAGLESPTQLIAQGQFTYRSGIEAAELLLNRKEPPSAIFASNDDMAAAAITVAHRRGLNVPGEISICGFDDTDFAQSIWPELTTIHQPIAEMAGMAVKMLVDNVRASRNDTVTPIGSRLMPYRLMLRDSTGPVAGHADLDRSCDSEI
jgi:LacI family transcriptional regulator